MFDTSWLPCSPRWRRERGRQALEVESSEYAAAGEHEVGQVNWSSSGLPLRTPTQHLLILFDHTVRYPLFSFLSRSSQRSWTIYIHTQHDVWVRFIYSLYLSNEQIPLCPLLQQYFNSVPCSQQGLLTRNSTQCPCINHSQSSLWMLRQEAHMAGLNYHSIPCPLLAGSKLLLYVSGQSQERSSL